jgi:hypothetical protein
MHKLDVAVTCPLRQKEHHPGRSFQSDSKSFTSDARRVDLFYMTGRHIQTLSGTEINKGVTLKAGAYLIRATGIDGSVFAARALVQ